MTTASLAVRCAQPTLGSRRLPQTVDVPRWLDDDNAVHAVIGAKRMYPPSTIFWPRLAVLAQFGSAIVGGRVKGSGWPELTGNLLRDLAAELPAPGIVAHDPRTDPSQRLTGRHLALVVDDLADCLTAVAVELAMPEPSDLDYLADLVDDLAIALGNYRNVDVALRTRRPRHARWTPRTGRDPPGRAAV